MKMKNKLYESAFEWLNIEYKDYHLYFDTPEKRFEYTPRSIWLINPKTNEWCFELENGGHLWYFYEVKKQFLEIFPIESSEFELIIKMWVEDVLKRGVSTTCNSYGSFTMKVEDVLKRGVSTTSPDDDGVLVQVEDALKRGVSLTAGPVGRRLWQVEDALKRGVSLT